MILHIFSIFDNKARAFIPPFVMAQPDMAKRTFSECANDPTHMFCKHPQDFNLYHIGEFNDETGAIENYLTPSNLGMAIQYKNDVSQGN